MQRCATYQTTSDQETIHLGQGLGKCLLEDDVVALVGELGSGKTWFTKGLALGLGISNDIIITSPSFALVNEYEGRCTFFHMDAYRLESLSDFLSAGLDEYFYQNGIVALEWADRWPEILPGWRIKVELVIVDDHTRQIILSGDHPRALKILDNMQKSRVELRFRPKSWGK